MCQSAHPARGPSPCRGSRSDSVAAASQCNPTAQCDTSAAREHESEGKRGEGARGASTPESGRSDAFAAPVGPSAPERASRGGAAVSSRERLTPSIAAGLADITAGCDSNDPCANRVRVTDASAIARTREHDTEAERATHAHAAGSSREVGSSALGNPVTAAGHHDPQARRTNSSRIGSGRDGAVRVAPPSCGTVASSSMSGERAGADGGTGRGGKSRSSLLRSGARSFEVSRVRDCVTTQTAPAGLCPSLALASPRGSRTRVVSARRGDYSPGDLLHDSQLRGADRARVSE
jgi:hypothetical protein